MVVNAASYPQYVSRHNRILVSPQNKHAKSTPPVLRQRCAFVFGVAETG